MLCVLSWCLLPLCVLPISAHRPDMFKDPVRVLITGGAGQIAYSLVPLIAKGDVFGYDQPVILHLLDITQSMGVLSGIVMELQDCAFPLLKEVVATDDEKKAFTGIDAAVLLASCPTKAGTTRKDLLAPNAKIYESHGNCINLYAKKTVKVLVVCNPANTIAFICAKYAPSIPKENFSALTRTDHNRARLQIFAWYQAYRVAFDLQRGRSYDDLHDDHIFIQKSEDAFGQQQFMAKSSPNAAA